MRTPRSHRSRSSWAAVAFLAPWTGAAFAQSEFAPLENVWAKIPISILPGAFGKGVVCQLDENRLADAAILQGGSIRVLMDPGRRKVVLNLDTDVFHDLAVLPGTNGGLDALVTAGNGGVAVWELQGNALVQSHLLQGPWEVADRVVVTRLAAPNVRAAVLVWHSTVGMVHPLLLWRTTSGFAEQHYSPWQLPGPGPVALADFEQTSMPEVVVGLADGLAIRRWNGTQSAWYPGTETSAVVRCGTTAAGKARLAWVQQASGSSEIVVLDELGEEPFVLLEDEQVTSATSFVEAEGTRLAVRLTSGDVRILEECPSAPSTYSVSCSTLVDLAPHLTSQSFPLLAELDASSCDAEPDLLTFDDASSTGWLARGLADTPQSSSVRLAGLLLCGPHCADSPAVHMDFETLPPEATWIRVSAFSWNDVPQGPWSTSQWSTEVEVGMPVILDFPSTLSAAQAVVFEVIPLSQQGDQMVALGAVYYVVDGGAVLQLPDPISSCLDTLSDTFVFSDDTGTGTRGVYRIPGQGNCPGGCCLPPSTCQ